jgi:hypothetical protein
LANWTYRCKCSFIWKSILQKIGRDYNLVQNPTVVNRKPEK